MLDLQEPEWKGRWGASPGGADFQAIVSAMLELEGEDATAAWLDGMKENATVYQNNIAMMKAVNAGEVPGGVIYHYYWFRDQDETAENSANTELHYFGNQDPGAFVSVSGGGVLASSTHQERGAAVPRIPRRRGRPADPRRGLQLRVPRRERCPRPRPRCPHWTPSMPRPSTRRCSTDRRSSTS